MSQRGLIVVPGLGNPDLYAGASRYGDLIWSAGQVPVQESGEIPLGINQQVSVVLDNLERTLRDAGGGLDTLLKVNTYLIDLADFDAYNDVYVACLREHGLPPRTTVEIARLPHPMRIELEAVAHVREERK